MNCCQLGSSILAAMSPLLISMSFFTKYTLSTLSCFWSSYLIMKTEKKTYTSIWANRVGSCLKKEKNTPKKGPHLL